MRITCLGNLSAYLSGFLTTAVVGILASKSLSTTREPEGPPAPRTATECLDDMLIALKFSHLLHKLIVCLKVSTLQFLQVRTTCETWNASLTVSEEAFWGQPKRRAFWFVSFHMVHTSFSLLFKLQRPWFEGWIESDLQMPHDALIAMTMQCDKSPNNTFILATGALLTHPALGAGDRLLACVLV